MYGLYELESQRAFLMRTGFHHPKTGRPYPANHRRFLEAVRQLEEIEMAMEKRRIRR